MPSLLRVVDLHKHVREGGHDRVVLQGIDVEIEAGSTVALLGPSGSGKSTLLNLIAGLDEPTKGEIHLAGTEVSGLDDAARTRFRRRHLGMVFQAFHLLPTLTVEENVLLPLDLAGRADRQARERARGLCARVGLGDRLDAFPDVLSGGEQQRVALARALAPRPDLLLADEPTGSLDQASAELVLDLLDELRAQEDCAIVVATHSGRAAARCGRVLRIVDGRIVEERAAANGTTGDDSAEANTPEPR